MTNAQNFRFFQTQDDYSMFSKLQPPTSVANIMSKPSGPYHYVIPGSQVSNHSIYVQQQQNFDGNSISMAHKIKDEPESPTIRNLPATPKSNDPPTSQSEGTSNYTTEQQREEAEKQAEIKQQFVLAPTPAQLGKAPLQRRLNRSKSSGMFTLNVNLH